MLKKYKKIIIPFFIVVFSVIIINAFHVDSSKDTPKSKTGLFLGTIINITIYDPLSDQSFEKIYTDIFKKLQSIENKMSINIDNSEVSKINENAGKIHTKVSPETFYVINKGKYYSNLSNGVFDISIGPLVKLWGIGSDHARVPSKEEILARKKYIDFQNVLLDESNNTIQLTQKGMILDLGGIAKGYAADVICKYLKDKNIKNAIINLGGNIYALGSKPGSDFWNIGIQNPTEPRGAYVGIVHVVNKSVVTSGIYERFLIKNGIHYHHILSPFTGYPVENELASVSIIADHSIDGDGLSTTIFSLGIKNGSKLVESIEGIDAIFITKNNAVYITSGLKNNFTLKNADFILKNTI
ncbi:MAG: FAD:protein FMN transferase [Marinisporobacter sp.]|jgi:thiamine biosynthesis lipoprotein|nr:FAD:protein FMN transferase [Marinisporobacter sp.]